MERREILIVGTSAPKTWTNATCDNPKNRDILENLKLGILIAAVTETKLKVFGYSEEGELKSKCWPLPKNYRTEDPSVLEDLKLEEAEQILKEYFKETNSEISILEKATA